MSVIILDGRWVAVVSPERYAREGNGLVAKDSITGDWERIVLNYTVLPGYTAPWLQINRSDGGTEKVEVQKRRDWENKKNTVIFTGLDNGGVAVWGKKK